jgi:hypothetical protein
MFAVHPVPNPDIASEISMLRAYSPTLPVATISRLAHVFRDLRALNETGSLAYPYSTRELVNLSLHLSRYPDESLSNVLRNIFDFDAFDAGSLDQVRKVFARWGISLQGGPNQGKVMMKGQDFLLPSPQALHSLPPGVSLTLAPVPALTLVPLESTAFYLEAEERETSQHQFGRTEVFSEDLETFLFRADVDGLAATSTVVAVLGRGRLSLYRPYETSYLEVDTSVFGARPVSVFTVGDDFVLALRNGSHVRLFYESKKDRRPLAMLVDVKPARVSAAKSQAAFACGDHRAVTYFANREGNLFEVPRKEAAAGGGTGASAQGDARALLGSGGTAADGGSGASLALPLSSSLTMGAALSETVVAQADAAGRLEIVDLKRGTVRIFALNEIAAIARESDEVLVVAHKDGRVRRLQAVNLEQSLEEWVQLNSRAEPEPVSLEHLVTGREASSPKHGKEDPNNDPHVGGNTWAGGSGGADTAGLGGRGGPYRLNKGHKVHQAPDTSVSEEVAKRAKEMRERAFKERLASIGMTDQEHGSYSDLSLPVRDHVSRLREVFRAAKSRNSERIWLKHQVTGDLDEGRFFDGVLGETTVYKRRGKSTDPSRKNHRKKLRVVADLSGSMYRFDGVDSRLKYELQAIVLVMEAMESLEEWDYCIVGHSGDDAVIPLVRYGDKPKDEKERLKILKVMHAHTQYCSSGDHTVEAIVAAVKEERESNTRIYILWSLSHDLSLMITLSRSLIHLLFISHIDSSLIYLSH